jgi:cobalt-zinc-cadmium efflux system membrane fusion protein
MKAWALIAIGAALGLVLGVSYTRMLGKPDVGPNASFNASRTTDTREVKLSAELARRAELASEPVIKRPMVPSLELVGAVEFDPDAVADVGGRIPGRITNLMVTVGDEVREGERLLELESNDLGEALAAYLSAQANLIAAQNQAKRETALAEKQLSSAPMVESARANAQALKAEVAGTEQRLLAMGLTRAELNRLGKGEGPRRITLRAPISGEVVERHAVLGQVVDPTHPILRLADLRRLWVELALFERDLAHVHEGDATEIRSETYPDRKFVGKVAHVNATVDEDTRTAKVRIEVPNPERLLRPGQFVHARVEMRRQTEPVLAIPRNAVLQIDGEPSAFVALGQGRYLARPVEVGRVSDEFVEVKRGLVEGDRVVTEGGFVLKSELQR